MLSDFGYDSKTFAVSLGYARADSGDSRYRTGALGLRVRPLDWLQLTASIPYTFIDGEEVIFDQPAPGVDRRNEFDYDNDGLGDITVMAWFNLMHPFLPDRDEPDPELDEDELAEIDVVDIGDIGDPAVYFGTGVKLATGVADEWDRTKYDFDRSKAVTGEFSEADGILPARFQLGTGTNDPIVGALYQQRFYRFTPSVGLSYRFSGGENDVGYERGDSLSWAAGAKYIILQPACNRQFYVSGGFSGVFVLDDDFDHSEDTTMAFSQPKGTVEDTKGHYSYYNFGLGYDFTEDLTIMGSYQLPLHDPNDDSEYSFDRAFVVSLQYRF